MCGIPPPPHTHTHAHLKRTSVSLVVALSRLSQRSGVWGGGGQANRICMFASYLADVVLSPLPFAKFHAHTLHPHPTLPRGTTDEPPAAGGHLVGGHGGA